MPRAWRRTTSRSSDGLEEPTSCRRRRADVEVVDPELDHALEELAGAEDGADEPGPHHLVLHVAAVLQGQVLRRHRERRKLGPGQTGGERGIVDGGVVEVPLQIARSAEALRDLVLSAGEAERHAVDQLRERERHACERGRLVVVLLQIGESWGRLQGAHLRASESRRGGANTQPQFPRRSGSFGDALNRLSRILYLPHSNPANRKRK